MIFENIWSIISDAFFINSFFITLYRFFVGVLFSILISCLFVWVGNAVPLFGRLVKIIVALVQPIPKVVLFPVLLICIGMNDFARISLVVLGLFFTNFTILNNAVTKLMNESGMRTIKFYNVTTSKVFYFYYFKGLKEAILSILKNSVGYGLTLVIISESSFCNNGIGFLVWTYWERYEMLPLSITIMATSFIALVLNYLAEYFLEKI